jgi:transposase InsO family protein
MRASMSRRGNCYDNAPIESFWGSLKSELIYHTQFATREQARLAIGEYIEMFYNRQRTQAQADYLSHLRIDSIWIIPLINALDATDSDRPHIALHV